jgi:hypothetical protein
MMMTFVKSPIIKVAAIMPSNFAPSMASAYGNFLLVTRETES